MDYSDIINHEHHVSSRHPQMSLRDRAAQFAPFAALTGHNAAIEKTAVKVREETELQNHHPDYKVEQNP